LRTFTVIIAGICFTLTAPLKARDLGDFTLGLNVHRLYWEGVLDHLHDLNINATRVLVAWEQCSDANGRIDPQHNNYISILEAPDFINTQLPILCYSHPVCDHGGRPTSQDGRQKFVRYSEDSAEILSKRTHYFEIWNEWNTPGMWNIPLSEGSGKPKDYVALLKETALEIKNKDPKAIILGSGTWGIGDSADYMPKAINAGLLESVDGLVIHPYIWNERISQNRLPEIGLVDKIKTVKGWLSAKRKSATLPIYVTEIGWPTYAGKNGVLADEQAKFLARSILLIATESQIKGVWIHELKDAGNDPKDVECHFGLLENNGKPKPSYFVMRELARLFHESKTIQQMPTVASDQILFMKLTDVAGASKIICWTVQPKAPWNIIIHATKDSIIHAHEVGAADIVLKPNESKAGDTNCPSIFEISIPDMPVVLSGLSETDTIEPILPSN